MNGSGFIIAFLYFLIYAFIGWCVEVIYHGVMQKKFVNRGFLNGPLCPVYGLGFYGVIIVLTPYMNNFACLYIGSMIITTTIELVTGFLLHKIFGLRWWDYSKNRFNLGGYICPKFSIYWGTACSFAMLVVHPVVSGFVFIIPDIIKLLIVCVCGITFIFDIISTVMMVLKIKKKFKIITDTSVEIRSISDKIGSGIYSKVEPVVKHTKPMIESYAEIKALSVKNREEEKALALKHRAEERALYEKLFAKEKEELYNARKKLYNKVNDTVHSFTKIEKSICKRVTQDSDSSEKKFLSGLINREIYKKNAKIKSNISEIGDKMLQKEQSNL